MSAIEKPKPETAESPRRLSASERYDTWNTTLKNWVEHTHGRLFLLFLASGAVIWLNDFYEGTNFLGRLYRQQVVERSVCLGAQPDPNSIAATRRIYEEAVGYARMAADEPVKRERALGEAKERFLKVLAAAPGYPEVNSNLAGVLMRQGDLAAARQHLEQEAANLQCLEKLPDRELAESTKPLWGRADMGAAHQMRADARRNLHYNWACYHALGGRESEALASLNRAVDAGFASAAQLRQDEDLRSLASSAPFQELIVRLERLGPTPGDQ